jgi:hypothetical protein
MAQISVANRSTRSGIILGYAISWGQDAWCSCRDSGVLLVVSGDCRLDRSAAQRFRAKLLAHADSDRFPDT